MSENQNRGPQWSKRLPAGAHVAGWEIRRAPIKGALVMQIWSHDIEVAPTHNVCKRTQPCIGDACTICAAGTKPRYHAYLAGMQLGTYEKIVIEVTAKIAKQLEAHFAELRTLRGAYIRLSRLTPVPNGKILAQVTPAKPTDAACPEGPNVRAIMERCWKTNMDWTTQNEREQIKPLRATGTDDIPYKPENDHTNDHLD